MNPSNFDWLDQLPTNDTNVDMTLQSLGMESNDLATNNIGGEQDMVKYLFDNAQFPLPAIPVNSPPHSDNGSNNSTADGGSPISLATATMNNNPTPAFDHSWTASLNPQPTFSVFENKPVSHSTNVPPPPKPKPAKESASRKMRIKKKREPIFVTESPQNAYKKRNKKSSGASLSLPPIDENEQHQQHQQHQQQDSSSSPSSHFDDDDDDDVELNESSLDKQHLTSKERRQLRNKISARNFRVRRKGNNKTEYISQLENKVDEQDDEIDSLKLDNKRLTSLNEQLLQEVMELRLQLQQPALAQQQQQQPQAVAPPPHYQQQPGLTVSPTSSSSSDSNSPPDFMEALLDFSLFNNFDNNRNNTYLSHSLMPDFDLSHVLGDKLAHPPSSTQLEEHRELMTMYPLLAPTLASIVIRHTFSLHYFAYLSNAFPYDSSATSSKHDTILDILHPDDWVTAATKHGDDDGDDEDPNNNQGKLVSAHVDDSRRSKSSSNDADDDATWTREFEQEVIQGHYAYYALMRLRGLSHDEIMRRCHACMERRKEMERQRRQKAATSCGKFQTLQAFTSVASALLRNPSRSPMIAEVIHETKACRMGPKKNKATLMVSAPFRAALRIGNGKS